MNRASSLRFVSASALVLGISGLLAAATNQGVGQSALFFTQTFNVHGPCDNADMVYRISINGAPPGNGTVSGPGNPDNGLWKIKPWLPVPIKIIFTHLIKFSGGPHYSFMVGSNVTGDAMLFLDRTQTSEKWTFPPGTYKAFPASTEATATQYMDLHGSCGPGVGDFEGLLTFGYTQ